MSKAIKNTRNATLFAGNMEIIHRYGKAGAEFLKGLMGVDSQTGEALSRSLQGIADSAVHPDYADQNIKQQAGFSAEVASVSARNAKAIVQGDPIRFARSEDVEGYQKNDQTVDLVALLSGDTLFTSQMKFQSEEGFKATLRAAAQNKNSYMAVDKLEIPSEQVETMQRYCQDQAEKLAQQIEALKTQGEYHQIQALQQQADNYQILQDKITDAGLTTQEAIAYRLDPNWETAKDIGDLGLQAGIEGAQLNAAIVGVIELIRNAMAVHSGDKELGEALRASANQSLKAAGFGFVVPTVGLGASLVAWHSSGDMSDEAQGILQTMAEGVNLYMYVSLSKSAARFVKGEIDANQFAEEVAALVVFCWNKDGFGTAGQTVIPIPVLGGFLGVAIGNAVCRTLYNEFKNALKEAKLSEQRREKIEKQYRALAQLAEQYQQALASLFDKKIKQIGDASEKIFSALNNKDMSSEEFCAAANQFAETLGHKNRVYSAKKIQEKMLSGAQIVI